jgi:protocatechuate 3,4-dioxygenase beta subunit
VRGFSIKRIILAFLSVLLVQLAVASTTITGTVTVQGPDAPTGPIAGAFALVSRPNFPNQIIATAKTDANGNYTISGLLGGNYQVVFTKPGFAQGVMAGFSFADNATAVLNAHLVPILTGTEVEMKNEKQETKFTISNPNSFSVHYQWQLPHKGMNGSSVAPPGNSTLDTVIPPHVETVQLFVDGNQVQPLQSTDVAPPVVIANISGTVDDSITGAPVAGVNVTLNDILACQKATTTTTLSDGSYVFHNTTAGLYLLSYTLQGYYPALQLVLVPASGLVVPTVYLKPIPPPPSSTVDVTVKDSNNNPAPNIDVSISYSSGPSAQGTTDGNGNVVFVNQPVNVAADITATTNDGTGRTASASSSGFSSGTNAITLVLPPIPGGSVSGTVTTASGSQLAAANVVVVDSMGNSVASGVTGSDGSFSVTAIAPGTYTLVVSVSGYITDSIGGVIITSANNTNEGTIVLNSAFAATVGVTVVDSDGYPVPSLVTISYSNGSSAGPLATDSNGFVNFTSQAQSVSATVSAAATDGTSRSGSAPSQSFITGSNAVLIVLPPGTAGSITGTVKDSASGNPISGASVSAIDSNGNGNVSTTTNAQGQYTLSGLELQNYTLTFNASGYTGLSGVSVPADTTYNAQLTAVGATVQVHLVLPGFIPVPGATVTIVYANGATPALGSTDSNGNVTFTGQPIGVQATIAATTSDGRSGSETSTFSAGVNQRGFYLSNPMGNVSGTVVDSGTSAALSGVSVAVVDWNNKLITTVTTGSAGNYSVTGLAPGSYSFTYTLSHYQTLTLTVPVTGGVTTTENASLTPTPGGIQGQVKGSVSQGPVPGCTITIQGPASGSTTTDSNGNFSFSGLPPGNYTGTLVQGIFSQPISATVVSGEVTTLNLILDTSNVVGKITDQNGNILVGATVVLTGAGFVSSTVVTDSNGNFVVNRENNTGDLTLNITWTDPSNVVWTGTNSFTIGSFNPPSWNVGTIFIQVGP